MVHQCKINYYNTSWYISVKLTIIIIILWNDSKVLIDINLQASHLFFSESSLHAQVSSGFESVSIPPCYCHTGTNLGKLYSNSCTNTRTGTWKHRQADHMKSAIRCTKFSLLVPQASLTCYQGHPGLFVICRCHCQRNAQLDVHRLVETTIWSDF